MRTMIEEMLDMVWFSQHPMNTYSFVKPTHFVVFCSAAKIVINHKRKTRKYIYL